MSQEYIAHVRKNNDGTWALPHGLTKLLENTARIAEFNAAKFHSGEWGRTVGLAHDVGKGREVWQKYLENVSGYDEEAHLEGKKGKIPHAIYGAKLVEKLYGKGVGRLLAYCIAGHHAGLPDWSAAEGSGKSSLQYQEAQLNHIDDIHKSIIEIVSSSKPGMPPWKFSRGLDLSLWIRMLYSTLVDADFLDTELYMDEDKSNYRGKYY